MTRALLEQALAALEGVLDAPVGVAAQFWSCAGGVYEAVECNNAINALQAELAKPPTQPAWHDAPTEAGLWLSSLYLRTFDIIQHDLDEGRFSRTGHRWFGPIPLPEDTNCG